MFNKLKVAQAEKQIYPQSVGQTNEGRSSVGRNSQPAVRKWPWHSFMVPSVCRIGSGIRGSHRVCGRALVVCSRCGETLWRGSIRRVCSLVNVRGPNLWLLPERRFCDQAWVVVVEFDYADVPEDVPQVHPVRSSKATNGKAANKQKNQTSPGAGTGDTAGAGVRCGAVMTRMTAVRMTAAAMTVRSVMVSPRISQPRNSATTGFTNAYVATRAAVLFCRM